MNLKDLSIETKEVAVPFEALPGFEVTLGYISKTITRKLAKDATSSKMGSNGELEQDFDQEAFLESFCKEAVKDWKGLTYSKLAQLMLIDEDAIEDMEKELPYSEDNAFVLLNNSPIFDNWVNERVNDLATFRSK